MTTSTNRVQLRAE